MMRGRSSVGWVVTPAAGLALLLILTSLLARDKNDYLAYLYGVGLVYAVATLGLHLLVNDSGDLSLSHGAQVAIGAFVGAHLFPAGQGFVGAVLLLTGGVVSGALSGLLVGALMLRLRGLAVAIVTLLLNAVVFRFVLRFPAFVGGSGGLRVGDGGWLPDGDTEAVVWLSLITLVAVLTTTWLRRSRFGLGLRAIRANRQLAFAVGVPVDGYRVTAYAVAGSMAGLAGAMWVVLHHGVAPSAFTESASLLLLTTALLGGPGSIVGPMAAAVLSIVLIGWLGEYGVAISFLAPIALIYVLIKHPGGINEQLHDLGRAIGVGLRRLRGGGGASRRRQEILEGGATQARAWRRDALGDLKDHEPALRTREVSVRFGGLQAVDRVSIEVFPGEVRALVGPNGAGKTTLLGVISGHIRPTNGTVWLVGSDVTHERANRRAAQGLRRTFQVSGHLPDESGLEHFRLGMHVQRKIADSEFCATVDTLCLELGLSEADVAQRLRDLPAGTARLIEIGTALALPGHVLLLDEPSTGLTPAERRRLAATVRSFANRGLAIVVVDHDTEFVRHVADKVTAMDAGRIIVEGTPNDVFADRAFVTAYMGVAAAI